MMQPEELCEVIHSLTDEERRVLMLCVVYERLQKVYGRYPKYKLFWKWDAEDIRQDTKFKTFKTVLTWLEKKLEYKITDARQQWKMYMEFVFQIYQRRKQKIPFPAQFKNDYHITKFISEGLLHGIYAIPFDIEKHRVISREKLLAMYRSWGMEI